MASEFPNIEHIFWVRCGLQMTFPEAPPAVDSPSLKASQNQIRPPQGTLEMISWTKLKLLNHADHGDSYCLRQAPAEAMS